MKNVNWYKVAVIAAIVIAIFFLGRSCGIKSVLKTTGSDTTLKKDSITIAYMPVPVLIKHDSIVNHYPEFWHIMSDKNGSSIWMTIKDTTIGAKHTEYLPIVDTAAILARYFETAYYDTTHKIKRGTVRIIDTVTQNRITGTRLVLNLTDSTITNTIVLHPPKRTIVFFGLNAMGSKQNPFYAAGIDLSLKGANDKTYSIGSMINKDGRFMYQIGYRVPLRISKNR